METRTANRWTGSKCHEVTSAKEVAVKLREYIKKNAELSACKWSITSKWGMYGDSLAVALMEAPFAVFTEDYPRGYMQNAIHRENRITEQAFRLLSQVRDFVLQYIWDDGYIMTDYFDRNIYDSYDIGKWDKPFKQIQAKPVAVQVVKTAGLQLVDYSGKAVALIGDTRAIKDQLKELGGRFNARLTCGAGWIFSKRKEAELKAMFAI